MIQRMYKIDIPSRTSSSRIHELTYWSGNKLHANNGRDLSTFRSEFFALVRRAERRVYRRRVILSPLVIFSSTRVVD